MELKWPVALVLFVSLVNSHPLARHDKLRVFKSKMVSNGVSWCHNEATFCTSAAGCCPKANAVCCDDTKHCCPEGYTCNTESGNCIKGDMNIHYSWKEIQSGLQAPLLDDSTLNPVRCQDGSECPAHYTCCHLEGNPGTGCCDHVNAVCCSDNIHCCPENTTCDPKNEVCVKKGYSIPSLKTYYGETLLEVDDTDPDTPVGNIFCPDGKTQCPNKNTCCKLETDSYACCPKPEANCCDDHIHCCPHGYSCNPNTDKCNHSDSNIPFLAEAHALPDFPSLKLKIICGDDTVCGLNDTCCEHPDGSWACCPATHAVCCSDGHHCCPENHICDNQDFTCKQDDTVVPFIEIKNEPLQSKIIPGLDMYSNLVSIAKNTVFCPGEKFICESSQTCCSLDDHVWGCCPGNEATCCPDKVHCCPGGYQCGKDGKCLQIKLSTDIRDLL